MTSQQKIDKFYKDLAALGLKFPGARIQERTGYSKGVISQYLKKTLTPSEDFIDAFNKEFEKDLKKVSHGTPVSGVVVNEPEFQYEQKSQNLQEKMLADLIESNRKQADALLLFAESARSLTRSHERLVERTGDTAHESQRIDVDLESRLSDLWEMLAEVGAGKRWKSKAEAIAELNKFVASPK